MRVRELPEEAGFPQAGLADHAHDLAVTGLRILESAAERVKLGETADEATEPACRAGLQPGSRHPRPGHLVDLDRLAHPLHGHGAERPDVHVALSQPQRPGRDQDRARHGHLLEPGGQMGRLPDRGIVHVQIAADRADHDLPGVESDPDLDGDPGSALDLLGVALDGGLHPERRVARPYPVVLVSEGRAEERHDPVAHHLVHRPLVAVDRLHHQLEHRVEDLSRLLRVAFRKELHRAFQVGKEDSYLLPLAFQRGL
jgi:hypothetical protein